MFSLEVFSEKQIIEREILKLDHKSLSLNVLEEKATFTRCHTLLYSQFISFQFQIMKEQRIKAGSISIGLPTLASSG